MNDSCTTMRRLLSEASDRALTTSELTGLRAHLTTCPGCRAFERDLQVGLTGIARLPRVSGNPAVRAAVMAGVHPGGRSAWPRGWRGWAGQTLKLAGAISAFALVAVILMTIFSGTGSGEPDERFSGAGGQPDALSEPTATSDAASFATPAQYVPQPCHPDQVAFETVVDAIPSDPVIGMPAYVRIAVHALKSTGGVECLLSTPVSLAISDADGAPLDIQGNPATGTFDATLGAGDAQIEFAWLNWCGGTGSFDLSVEMLTSSNSGSALGQPIQIRPLCEDAAQPSKLGLADAAQPFPSEGTCQAGQVVLTSSDLSREGDDVYIWLIASNLDDCADDEPATVMLSDETGTPMEIDGNSVELTLQPSESGEFQWAGLVWSNWCGAADGASLDVKRDGSGFGAWIHVTPACLDDSQPSRLTISEVAPPDEVWPGDDPGAVMPGLAVEPPVCDPATLDLSLTPQPTHGDIIIEVNAGVDSETAPVCALDGDLSITISGADGQPLAVDGNGLTLNTEGGDIMRVVPAPGIAHVIWENWCGESGPFTITVTHEGQEATAEVANGPDCAEEDQPSTLQPLADADDGK